MYKNIALGKYGSARCGGLGLKLGLNSRNLIFWQTSHISSNAKSNFSDFYFPQESTGQTGLKGWT